MVRGPGRIAPGPGLRFRARERQRDVVERLKEFLPPNERRHRTLASSPRLALALQDAADEIERMRDVLNRVVCVSLIHEPLDSRGNNLKGGGDDWYLSVLLDPVQPWWRRLWRALRPRDGRFGIYAEIVLRDDDVRRLAAFIDRRLGPPDPPPG